MTATDERRAVVEREVIGERLAAMGLAAARDLPDDGLGRVPSEFRDDPDVMYASTLEGMRGVIREAARLHPWISVAACEADIAHEAEHAAAARMIGCASRFGLKVGRTGAGATYTVMVHEFARPGMMTKLAFASMAAAPARLSEGDLADLRAMGYRDAEDVAARIREHNRHAAVPLLVPLSARLTGES